MPIGDVVRTNFAITPTTGLVPTTIVTNRPGNVFLSLDSDG